MDREEIRATRDLDAPVGKNDVWGRLKMRLLEGSVAVKGSELS